MNLFMFFSITPNSIALTFLACAALNLFFAIYLLHKKSGTMTILWFVLFTIVTGLSDLSNGLVNMSSNKQMFSFWVLMKDFFDIAPAPLLLYFSLSFANKNAYLKKLWVILPVFGAFFFMLFISWRTEILFSHDITQAGRAFWGMVPKTGRANPLIGVYFLVIQLFQYTALIHFYITNKDQKRKKQTKIMLITFIVVFVVTTFTEGFLPNILHSPVFPSIVYTQVFLVVITIYVFSKYGLEAFNIDSISEKILQLIPSAVIIIDTQKIIEHSNPSAEKLFHYAQADFFGKPVHQLFPNEEAYIQFESKILTPLTQENSTQWNDAQIRTADEKYISVNIQAALVKDPSRTGSNTLLIFTDINEIKNKSKQLEEKFKEVEEQKTQLERFNKLMVDREKHMIELKNENERLKKTLEQK